MTIQFEKLKARLLANPKVKAVYDALAPEFVSGLAKRDPPFIDDKQAKPADRGLRDQSK
jgi:hypothetical protein